MLALTAISAGNQWLGNDNAGAALKVAVAGAVAAGGLALLEHVPGMAPLAAGIAWVALITLLFTSAGGGRSPVQNIKRLTGL
jgi:hypothetical protein